jgi:hypothetical protein
MIEILGLEYDTVAKIKAAFLEINVFNFRGKLCLADRKVTICQLPAHNIFKRVIFIGNRPVDLKFRPGNVNWREKGESHNVVPMGMGQKNLRPYRTFGKVMGHHVVAQLSNAGAGINNNKPVWVLES